MYVYMYVYVVSFILINIFPIWKNYAYYTCVWEQQ